MAKYVYPAIFKPENEGYSEQGELVTLVMCDTIEYRRYYDNKAVKKTLTIPAWLNTMAERAGLNFSQVLQNGLKNELHVQ